MSGEHDARRGALYALLAYGAWGLLPVYWKLLKHVAPLVVLSHRVLWSAFFLLVLVAIKRRGLEALAALRSPKIMVRLALSTTLLAINWYVYIWAVGAGHVLDASLGYFITPIVNVILGLVFLNERLRALEWLAVTMASLGVAVLAFSQDASPWIPLTLATSFGLYGLVRKTAQVDSLLGLSLETLLMVVPALGFLSTQSAWFGDRPTTLLLIGTGVVTSMPLLWFADAARRLPLSVLAFFQYIAPTLQFLLAVALYHEPLTRAHIVTFGFIWTALALFTFSRVQRIQPINARSREAETKSFSATRE